METKLEVKIDEVLTFNSILTKPAILIRFKFAY